MILVSGKKESPPQYPFHSTAYFRASPKDAALKSDSLCMGRDIRQHQPLLVSGQDTEVVKSGCGVCLPPCSAFLSGYPGR